MLTSIYATRDAGQKRNWLVLAATGLVIGLCFVGLAILHNLLQNIIPFLILYCVAYLAYGVAVWRLVEGDRDGAVALLREIVEEPYWARLGHVAAEADLIRLEAVR